MIQYSHPQLFTLFYKNKYIPSIVAENYFFGEISRLREGLMNK